MTPRRGNRPIGTKFYCTLDPEEPLQKLFHLFPVSCIDLPDSHHWYQINLHNNTTSLVSTVNGREWNIVGADPRHIIFRQRSRK